MRATIRIGTISGVRVGIHWSVLAIWSLLTWSLATTLLPDDAPGHGGPAYWAAAGAAAAALLACLLAHEVSHAVVAQRSGVPTESITLWALGGVAALREQPPTARSALGIAAVGPLASLLLAGAFALTTLGAGALDAPLLLAAVLRWLATVNLLLGLFNLLPGIPLDGGRVLHALLWWRTGDRDRSTRTAAAMGRGLGYALVGLGALQLLSGWVQGMWTALIGWFLVNAAGVEAAGPDSAAALAGVRVRDAMTPHPDVVQDDLALDALVAEMLARGHVSFPVVDAAGEVVGLVSMEGVRRVQPARRGGATVRSVMVPLGEVDVVSPDEPLAPVAARTAPRGRVLVLDGGDDPRHALVGILSATDIDRALRAHGVQRR
ncbi:MAG TPA: site-2 protease family protein [Acidimicrobiales bacterium]|nr:site-2 protease family protein [Acidimicrobiales bacterium]